MNMVIAGIDFETTSVDPQTCHPTEFAIVLWNPLRNFVIESLSFVVAVPKEISIDNADITGIDRLMIDSYGIPWSDYAGEIIAKMKFADFFMAHNADFDKTILQRMFDAEFDPDLRSEFFSDSRWIDTMVDLPYPPRISTRGLMHLAADHGFLNPFPHRALFDVMTTIKIASMYPIDEVIRNAQSPTIWIRASVTMEDRQLAKNRNYRWDPMNKFWVKQIKDLYLVTEEAEAEFPIDILKGYVFREAYA